MKKAKKRTKKEMIALRERAWEHVQSVPYKVSGRWLFYRLYQEGLYVEKRHYETQFVHHTTGWRKDFQGEWRPDTVIDEGREILFSVDVDEKGLASVADYRNFDVAERMMNYLEKYSVRYPLDHFYHQDYYVEIWFEAKAMIGQFQHYTNGMTLVPLGGQASIPLKWDMAQNLKMMAERYERPIVILYFGDHDYWGEQIRLSAEKDVRLWSDVDFEIILCGITERQATLLNVPESVPDKKKPKPKNIDKERWAKWEGKNKYQWEALDDESAGKIITHAVNKYVSQEIIDEVAEEQKTHEEKINAKIRRVFEKTSDDIKRLIENVLESGQKGT